MVWEFQCLSCHGVAHKLTMATQPHPMWVRKQEWSPRAPGEKVSLLGHAVGTASGYGYKPQDEGRRNTADKLGQGLGARHSHAGVYTGADTLCPPHPVSKQA